VFNATGYSSQTLLFDFSTPGVYEIDRSLFQSELSPVSITSFGVGQTNYAAYADVGLTATVFNESNAPVEGVLEFTLMNSDDQVVAVVQGNWVDISGVSDTTFTLDAGMSQDFSAMWNTGSISPGSYRAIARVVVGDLMVGPSNITLAERATSFDIDTTEALAKVEVSPQPAFSGVGRTEDVDFVLDLVNRSNVTTDLSVRFQVSRPDGQVIHTHTEAVSLAPEEDNKRLDIPGIPILFESSGSYPVSVEVLSQQRVDTVSGGDIAVAPGVRIEAIQNIAPQTVTPDEDKRVRLNIRLEGVELK
jgi:hypothetical protein